MEQAARPVSRRGFLLGVGGAAMLSACGGGGGAGGTSASAATSGTAASTSSGMKVPLSIDLSQANLPAGASTVAYAYIIGGLYTDAALTNFVCYRVHASGSVHAVALADNTQAAHSFPDPNGVVGTADTQTIDTAYPSAWADYSIALSLSGPNYIELGNIDTANIPGLGTGNNAFSMRVYISLGIPKLPFTAQAGFTSAGVTHVNPYAGPGFDTGTPGSLCLYDWFECSIDSGGVLNGNTTYVDQFGMPLIVAAQPGASTQGRLNVTRQQALAAISGFDQTVYKGLTQAVSAPSAYPAGTSYLRAISPDHLSGLGLGSGLGANFNTYFDTVIGSWNGKTITVTDSSSGTFTCASPATGNWSFTDGTTTFSFTDVNTANIWQCAGTMASGGAAQKNIGKQILAAFNRGQMSDTGLAGITLSDASCPAPVPDPYYQFAPSNLWAHSFHNWSTTGLAYGFAYDDVCAANPSFTTSGAMTSLSITLGTMF